MLVTGADIPEDLFDLILDFLQLYNQSDRNNVGIDRRGLGCVALVCRRWGRICQTKIFERTTLRSRQDFLDLWSFLARPGSIIPRALVRLILQYDAGSAPWLHLVCQKLPHRMLHPEFEMFLKLDGKQETPVVLGRSIHGSLPRQPFAAFSLGIEVLYLTHVHFRSLESLAHLVGEMPSLQTLQCTSVTWPSPPDDSTHLKPILTRRSHNSVKYYMSGCTDDCAVVLLSSHLLPMKQTRLHSGEADVMHCMTRAVVKGEPHIRSVFTLDSDTKAGVIIVNGLHTHLSFSISSRSFPSILQVSGISVQSLDARRSLTTLQAYDWRTFDVYAASLSILSRAVLGFFSFEEVKVFANDVDGSQMPYLSSTNKIRYALRNPPSTKESQWIAVSPGMSEEDLVDAPRHYLQYNELHLMFLDAPYIVKRSVIV